MATTADELLQEGHGALRRSMRSLPGRGPSSGRPAAAFDLAQGTLAGWPELAKAQATVLRSVALTPPQQTRTEPVLTMLDKIASREPVANTVPDSQFARGTDLIRAAADALAVTAPPTGYPRRSDGTIDEVLGGVATAAQVTSIYIEAARYLPANMQHQSRTLGPASPWFDLATAAKAALASPSPSGRLSEAGSVPVLATHDVGLGAALEQWRRSAVRVSAPTKAPTADFPAIARSLVDIHRAAWDAGIPGAGAAAERWRRSLADGWGSAALRIPGPADQELRDATHQLRDALESSAAAMATGRGTEAQALEAFLRSHAEFITEAYTAQVGTVVHSEQVAVSARLLMSALSKPYPVDVAMAGQRGRWVPLPAGSPPAQQLLDTTGAAQRASGEMVAGMRARDQRTHPSPGLRPRRPEIDQAGITKLRDAFAQSQPERNHAVQSTGSAELRYGHDQRLSGPDRSARR